MKKASALNQGRRCGSLARISALPHSTKSERGVPSRCFEMRTVPSWVQKVAQFTRTKEMIFPVPARRSSSLEATIKSEIEREAKATAPLENLKLYLEVMRRNSFEAMKLMVIEEVYEL